MRSIWRNGGAPGIDTASKCCDAIAGGSRATLAYAPAFALSLHACIHFPNRFDDASTSFQSVFSRVISHLS